MQGKWLCYVPMRVLYDGCSGRWNYHCNWWENTGIVVICIIYCHVKKVPDDVTWLTRRKNYRPKLAQLCIAVLWVWVDNHVNQHIALYLALPGTAKLSRLYISLRSNFRILWSILEEYSLKITESQWNVAVHFYHTTNWVLYMCSYKLLGLWYLVAHSHMDRTLIILN